MATPHVSGVAALVWSHFPGKSNVEIRNALAATALDAGPPGRDDAYGFGIVQAKAAYDYLACGIK
jgi:subtilisin family serine protease